MRECVVFRVKNETGHFRLGITLKARGSSIDRNRVKRQIRESMRVQAALLGSYDYNVVVPATRQLSYIYAQKLAASIGKDLPYALAKAVK